MSFFIACSCWTINVMFVYVLETFVVPVDDKLKKLIIMVLNDKYRSYRTNLKRFNYDKYPTYEERLQHCPQMW